MEKLVQGNADSGKKKSAKTPNLFPYQVTLQIWKTRYGGKRTTGIPKETFELLKP